MEESGAVPERAIDPAAVESARQNMLSRPAEERARRLLDGLCDPTRVKIVRALRSGPLAASDIAKVVERSRAATSQHLKVLRELGAVEPARNGNIVRYSLAPTLTAEILDQIGDQFDKLEASPPAA
ncbi:MAG TPA: metalloregulator ArsR/SmtB family transcription factor [Candidatus Limnocylindria bacterium]|nr:metalloregulator ArsR/SmtB family transcription factor [Candidatus Limnocylindria bacterium]